ncbi:MAG: transcriptional repressor LexA [Myxococcota bacterium]|jgi:repressor LexA|nr:transcriptional repressor LexA [Myxococcota bacterium]MEC9441273.1 transcriptional repressor LexA [Myxococcota bacterium]
MTTPKKLTKRQRMVLRYIIDHIQDHGFPPTIREIGDHMGIKSTNGVNDHLKALERKDYLERKDAKSRALKPLRNEDGDLIEETTFANVGGASNEDMEDVYQIPVVGRIAAGLPITAIENTENILRIGQGMLGRTDSSDIFALTVSGDSMIEDGIFDGDYIFVKRQQDARDGEIVAAMVDGEATVKRLFREGERVRLQPANSTMEPIYVHAHEARETMILGKVVGVYRQLV